MTIQQDKEVIAQARAIFEKRAKYKNATAFTSPSEVFTYLLCRHDGLEAEHFDVLFLDNRHRLISAETMFKGTIDSAAVYPREIIKRALELNAAAVIFSHNHPSGVAEPSDTDVRLTRKLIDGLSLVDIRVLDHVVTGSGVATSFAERGLL
jgi:DNA repair protein RadC